MVAGAFDEQLNNAEEISGIPVLRAVLPNADMDALREMSDKFRQKYPSGVVVLASDLDDKPILIAAVTDDLVKRGLHAGKLIQQVAKVVGGGGMSTSVRLGGGVGGGALGGSGICMSFGALVGEPGLPAAPKRDCAAWARRAAASSRSFSSQAGGGGDAVPSSALRVAGRIVRRTGCGAACGAAP